MINRDEVRKVLIQSRRPTFGAHLKFLRVEAGLSLRQLAERAGLSHPYVHDLERDRRHPSEAAIHKLAKAIPDGEDASQKLDVRLGVFYTLSGTLGEDATHYLSHTPDAIDLIRLIASRNLTQRQISRVFQFVDSLSRAEGNET